MKVMVVGPTVPDAFADNVAWTLDAMGHQVIAAGAARKSPPTRKLENAVKILSDHVPSIDVRLQSRLVETARKFRPDFVITVDGSLRPATVRAIRRYASRTVLWFPDAVSNMGKHEMFLADYDRLYFKNKFLVDQLSQIQGLPMVYLPEAANSAWHRPLCEYGTEPYIAFVGSLHPTRAILLDRLVAAGIPLRIYGPPMSNWMDFPRVTAAHTGRFIARAEKAAVFRSARGVLNNLHPAEFAGSNCRLFEATASGAAVITEWREEMEELFDPRLEVLPFRSFDELLAVCRRVLSSPDEGRHISDAAAARSAREHTYEHRLHAMLLDLGLA